MQAATRLWYGTWKIIDTGRKDCIKRALNGRHNSLLQKFLIPNGEIMLSTLSLESVLFLMNESSDRKTEIKLKRDS